jgi:hypothetical protein
MATKKSKTTTKKTAKKKVSPKTQPQTAKVKLDAATVQQFESHLRDGLVGSGAVMMSDNKALAVKPTAQVELDPATAARLSEKLRKGLVSSQAVMSTDSDKLDDMTGKVKDQAPRRKSKKR